MVVTQQHIVRVGPRERLVKQPQLPFQAQSASHRIAMACIGTLPSATRDCEIVTVTGREHFQREPPARNAARAASLSSPTRPCAANSCAAIRVANDKATEFPFITEHVAQQEWVGRRGHTIDFVGNASHQRRHLSRSRRPGTAEDTRRAKCARTCRPCCNLVRLPAAPSSDEMFRAGLQYTPGSAEVVSLKPRTMAAPTVAIQIGVFARTFRDAAPSRVARNIDHRRVTSSGSIPAAASRAAIRAACSVSWGFHAERPGRAGLGRSCDSRGSHRRRAARGCPVAIFRRQCAAGCRSSADFTAMTDPERMPSRTRSPNWYGTLVLATIGRFSH